MSSLACADLHAAAWVSSLPLPFSYHDGFLFAILLRFFLVRIRHYSLSTAFGKLESQVETQQPATEDAVLREKFKEATSKQATAVQKQLDEVDKWLSACMGLVEQPIDKIKTTAMAEKAVNDLRRKIEEFPTKMETLGGKPLAFGYWSALCHGARWF